MQKSVLPRISGGALLGGHVGAHVRSAYGRVRGRIHNQVRHTLHRGDIRLPNRKCVPHRCG